MSVTPARRVTARLVSYDWDWASAERDAIAAHWSERQARTPAIFDGRILMVCGMRVRGDDVAVEFFETGYANLTAWIAAGFPGDGTVANGFAMGALQAADGAYLLGRMADHTANAGRLYFPSGTPDRTDVGADGSVDLAGSLVREITEETGFAASELAVGDGWRIVRAGGLVGFMRPVRLGLDGEAARTRILAHLSRETTPELSDIKLVRSLADIEGEATPGVVPLYLRHALDDGPACRRAASDAC